MNNSMYAQAIDEIEKSKCVTLEIREKYFKGKDFKEIRNWLEEQNIDRHTAIEIKSAGILLYISMSNENDKVLVQVRSTEKSRLGLFGGGIEKDETPIECAIRELKEETGIETCKEQLEFFEINKHNLEYENGDKVNYIAYVYVLKFNEYPQIKLNNESNGIIAISKENYKDFTYIDDTNLLQLHKCWIETIRKVLNI